MLTKWISRKILTEIVLNPLPIALVIIFTNYVSYHLVTKQISRNGITKYSISRIDYELVKKNYTIEIERKSVLISLLSFSNNN